MPQSDEQRLAPPSLSVCMVSFYYSPDYSGSAVQAHNLSRYLMRRKVEPVIVSASLSSPIDQDRLDGIEIHRLPVKKNSEWTIPSFWKSLAAFLFRYRGRFRIIHAHGTLQHGIASLIGPLIGARTILKVAMANSDIAFHHQGRIWGRVNRFMVSRFDRYIATSREIYQEFNDRGLDMRKVRLIPNGVDCEEKKPATGEIEKRLIRKDVGIRDCPTVIYVGIINRRKNVDMILRVWKDVVARVGDCQLLLLGPYGKGVDGEGDPFYEELCEFVSENDLTDQVNFLGFQPNVTPYLQAADVFFFPSRQEGMPNVLLEAMACGLPCVVSRISGTEDIIEHDETGFLLEFSDETGFVSKIVGLLSDATYRERVGSSACRSVRENFSLDSIADRYLSLYKELVQEVS